MPIEVMDMVKMAREERKRKVIFNTNRFHAWLHVYPKPGDADDIAFLEARRRKRPSQT